MGDHLQSPHGLRFLRSQWCKWMWWAMPTSPWLRRILGDEGKGLWWWFLVVDGVVVYQSTSWYGKHILHRYSLLYIYICSISYDLWIILSRYTAFRCILNYLNWFTDCVHQPHDRNDLMSMSINPTLALESIFNFMWICAGVIKLPILGGSNNANVW